MKMRWSYKIYYEIILKVTGSMRYTQAQSVHFAIERYVEHNMHFFTLTFEGNINTTDVHTAPSYEAKVSKD